MLAACNLPLVIDPGPGPGPDDVNVVMTNGQEGIWAGGLARLPDGSFYIVYQRDAENSQAFGRVLPEIGGPPGPEEHLAGYYVDPQDKLSAYDPGVAVADDGSVFISWSNTARAKGVYLMTRLPNGRLTGSADVAVGPYGEATLGEFHHRVLLTYNHIPPGDPFREHFRNDVLVREIYGPESWGPPVHVASPAGAGTRGNQFRATISETGRADELLAVWNRPSEPAGGDRTIWGALSTTGGNDWGQSFRVAKVEGDDLVNPFAIRVESRAELRVYFVARHGPGGSDLTVVTSRDHGSTWSLPQAVPHPPGARGSPGRPVFVEVDGRVVCFASWGVDGVAVLGMYPVD